MNRKTHASAYSHPAGKFIPKETIRAFRGYFKGFKRRRRKTNKLFKRIHTKKSRRYLKKLMKKELDFLGER